jgi:hypothetical protein
MLDPNVLPDLPPRRVFESIEAVARRAAHSHPENDALFRLTPC